MDNYRISNKEIVTNGGISNNGTHGLPTKQNPWTKVKAFLLQEIKVELTPQQQEFENKMNDFLNQEIKFKNVYDFLFQEVKLWK